MAVDKRCLACDRYRDECVGKDVACGDFKPIDWQRTVPGSTKEVPVSPSPLQPAGETRREKFARIGNKRREQALEAIRKLEHLTSRYHRTRTDVTVYTYEWTAEQALDLVKPIEDALTRLKSELICCDQPYEHGMIEEQHGSSN